MIRLPAIAQAADLLTFLAMLALRGPSAEANPLVHAAIVGGALPAVLAAKLLLLVAVARLGHWRVGLAPRSVGAAALLVGILGAVSNVGTIA